MPRGLPQSTSQGEKKTPPYALMLLVLFNTILFFGIYCFFVMRNGVNWLFWVYLSVLLIAAIVYILYNYAFSRDKATFATLPVEWSAGEKEKYLRERDEHRRKSKWMLTVIFPLCITFLFDMVYLFFGDALITTFGALFEVLGL